MTRHTCGSKGVVQPIQAKPCCPVYPRRPCVPLSVWRPWPSNTRVMVENVCVNSSGLRGLVKGCVKKIRRRPSRCPLRSLSISVRDALGDLWQELGRVETSEALLSDEQRLPDHGCRVLDLLEPLGRGRPQPHGGERRLHHVRCSQVLPMLLRERVEGHQPAPVLRQAPAGGGDALPRGPRLERALLPLGLLP